MPRITLSIPDKLKKRMDKMPDVNWTEIIRRGMHKRVDELKMFEKLKEEGRLWQA